MKIGVIGIGTVGYPLYKALQFYHEGNIYCWDKGKKSDDWKHIIDTNIVFICVPTDMKKDGRLDMGIVIDVLNRLKNDKYKGLVVIKSTLGLGHINKWIKEYPFKIVVFPEWLRAAHAFPDTLTPEMTVIGDPELSSKNVQKILSACKWHKKEDVQLVLPEEAIMIKLTANALAATKITFANQIQLICEKYKINGKIVMKAIQRDPRCTARYLDPGKSYGGYCLPKDTSELENSVNQKNIFKSVREINEVFKKREKK